MLDIGCGDGLLTKKIMDSLKLATAQGIDLDPIANSKQPEGLTITRCNTDTESMPFPDNSFDFIHFGDVIEHVYYPDRPLREIHRLLTPDGLAIITSPNLAAWPSRLALLLGYYPYQITMSPEHQGIGKFRLRSDYGGQWGHIRVPTLRALKELLGIHNFSIIKIEGWSQGFPEQCLDTKNKLLPKIVGLVDQGICKVSPALAPGLALVVRKI
jgi:SAM-dependent methyltransferase